MDYSPIIAWAERHLVSGVQLVTADGKWCVIFHKMTNLQKLFPSNLDTVPERLTNMRKIIEKKRKEIPTILFAQLTDGSLWGVFSFFIYFFYNSRCHPFHTILNRALIQTKKLHKRAFQNLSWNIGAQINVQQSRQNLHFKNSCSTVQLDNMWILHHHCLNSGHE